MLGIGITISKTNNTFLSYKLTAVNPLMKADMIQNRFWLCCLHVRMMKYLHYRFCKHLTIAGNFEVGEGDKGVRASLTIATQCLSLQKLLLLASHRKKYTCKIEPAR